MDFTKNQVSYAIQNNMLPILKHSGIKSALVKSYQLGKYQLQVNKKLSWY